MSLYNGSCRRCGNRILGLAQCPLCRAFQFGCAEHGVVACTLAQCVQTQKEEQDAAFVASGARMYRELFGEEPPSGPEINELLSSPEGRRLLSEQSRKVEADRELDRKLREDPAPKIRVRLQLEEESLPVNPVSMPAAEPKPEPYRGWLPKNLRPNQGARREEAAPPPEKNSPTPNRVYVFDEEDTT